MVKVSQIMIVGRWERGKVGFCDSQKSRKGDITYFCERTGRILREDIKVCKLYIRKDSWAEPEFVFMIHACTISGRLKPIEKERYVIMFFLIHIFQYVTVLLNFG